MSRSTIGLRCGRGLWRTQLVSHGNVVKKVFLQKYPTTHCAFQSEWIWVNPNSKGLLVNLSISAGPHPAVCRPCVGEIGRSL